MAGVYTDNQPDFSWLLPYETKSFSQYWYPIQQIGPAKNANNRIAINLEQENGMVRMGASVTEAFQKARVILSSRDHILFKTTADILPGAPFTARLNVSTATDLLTLRVLTADGIELITWTRQDVAPPEHIPAPAKSLPPLTRSRPSRNSTLPACTWSSIAMRPEARNRIGKKPCAAIRSIAAATQLWENCC